MKITILNENTVYKRGFIAEHGLSILIENDDKRILFDMGQSFAFIHNAKYLNIPLNDLDAIIISHGHYDHTGGLEYLSKENINLPKIYVQKEAFFRKLNGDREIGIPWNEDDYRDNLYYPSDFEEIFKNVHLISNIPINNDFENVPSKFKKIKYDKETIDTMEDEQVLVIEEERGLFVFAGCSHRGIINILEHVNKMFNGKQIYLLFAGMHLISAKEDRVEKTICELKKYNIKMIMPVHCTGPHAINRISSEFKENFKRVETGEIIDI